MSRIIYFMKLEFLCVVASIQTLADILFDTFKLICMQQKTKKLILALLLTASCLTQSFSQSVVCRKERIYGYDEEYSMGHSICGETTTSMSKTKIYLTVTGENLYVHSNYITPEFEYPTKFATSDEMNSIDEVAMNIFFADYPSETKISQMNSMLRNNIEIIIDPKIINNSKYGKMNFTKTGQLKFICPDNEVRDAIKIQNNNGDFDLGIKYNNQFSTRVKDQNLSFIFSELRNQKIDFDKIKVINLVQNSSTKSVLNAKFSEKVISFDFSSKENFKSLLLSDRGKRIAIIGHIENGDFVTIDKAGKEIFRIPISEIETFQKENKLELIILGCNSASEGAGSGALNKFNSIDALNRLKTTEKTENIEQFLDSLSFGTLHFVIDETFFKPEPDVASSGGNRLPERIEISIYNKSKGEISSVSNLNYKGSIIILGLGTAEFIASLTTPSAKTDTSQVINPQSDSIYSSPENNGDKSDNTRNLILFIVIGVGVVGLIAYILKSSNKS